MKLAEQKKARVLRKKGLSLQEISTRIGCSKSSVSRWTKDITLTSKQIDRLKEKEKRGALKGRISAAKHPNSPKQVWSKRRKMHREAGFSEIKQNPDVLPLVIAALYWGEGRKNRNTFSLSNTDPEMIRLVLLFLRNEQVPEERIRFRVQLHPHLNEKKAKAYWAKVAKTKPGNIRVHKAISTASQQKKSSCPYGTFTVSYHDTLFRSRIEGWLDFLKHLPG